MAATGVAVLILAIVTGSVYASARAVDGQVSEFVSVGTQLDGIQMIGEQGLLAVADAQMAKIAAANAVVRDETNFLAAVSPNVSSSGQLIAGNNNYPASVNGVGTEYLEIRQLSVESGEMFTEADIQSAAKVCIIGKTIVDNLFPDGQDPIGHIIRFNQVPLRVVGVLKAKGYNSMGMDQDEIVLVHTHGVVAFGFKYTHYTQGYLVETDDMSDRVLSVREKIVHNGLTDDADFGGTLNVRFGKHLATLYA